MPCVEIFQNKKTGNIVLCSFVLCAELGGGDSPTGPLVYVSLDDFAVNAVDLITKDFELFDTRDYWSRSELYEDMTESERERFLSEHRKVIVSWPIENEPVYVHIGPHDDLYGRLDFPFDKTTFADYILKALAKAG